MSKPSENTLTKHCHFCRMPFTPDLDRPRFNDTCDDYCEAQELEFWKQVRGRPHPHNGRGREWLTLGPE